MHFSNTLAASETENPELLEAQAYELEAEAANLRARAKRQRAANVALAAAQAHAPAQLTPEDYARRCQVSVATIHRMKAAGMPVIPVGKRYRVVASEADAWRREHAASRPKRERKPAGDSAVNVTDVLGTGLRLAGGAR